MPSSWRLRLTRIFFHSSSGRILLIDRGAGQRLPRRNGLCVLSIARVLAIREVHVRLDGRFVVSSPGVSDEVDAFEIGKIIVGEIVWRGGRV